MGFATGERLGPYVIVGPLGAGGMGEVYRARDSRLGREVALKVLPSEYVSDPRRRARLIREARAVSALNHPHIVTIHDIETVGDSDVIVMELIAGESLAQRLRRGALPIDQALRCGMAIANALMAAHDAGIVHRDLKPGNVMVRPDGIAKVLDFGLAKLTQDEADGSNESTTIGTDVASLSHPGMVAGTVGYMSPEQAMGGTVDARSDIFAFGVVMYEMVTGHRPFNGKSSAEIIASVLKDQPTTPRHFAPAVPETLERLILRCLRKEPERRFQHMSDLQVELKEIADDAESHGAKAGATTTGARTRSRARQGLGLAALVVAMASGVLAWRAIAGRNGGAPVLVPLTATAGSECCPTFSPSGEEVAFSWEGERRENQDIYIKAVESSDAHRLTTDPLNDSWPSWSPDGRLIAFVRAARRSSTGIIHVVAPLGGTERKLSDGLVAVGSLSWSPDGRWLVTGAPAYANEGPRLDDLRSIRRVDTQTGELRSITVTEGANYHTSPVVSVDGRHLAYLSCFGRYSCQVDVVDLGSELAPTGPPRHLTNKTVWPRGLAWSRDGKSVIYAGGQGWRLSRVAIDGGSSGHVDIAGFAAFYPAVAASRDRMAFVRANSATALYRFEEGRSPEAVTGATVDRFPNLSPDGTRLVWESQRSGGAEIWIGAVDGTRVTQLTHSPGIWQGSPSWSPDGRQVAFDSYGDDGQWDIWTIDADGGPPRRVTSHPADDNMPSWSLDGRFIYFSSNRGGENRLWRAPAAGGPEHEVTGLSAGRSAEVVDGQLLVFQRLTRGNAPVLAMSLPGGPPRTIIDCAPRDGFAVGREGIYHIGCSDDVSAIPLFVFDLATGTDRQVGTVDGPLFNGLTVSPDGKTVMYSKMLNPGADLVLIEHFR